MDTLEGLFVTFFKKLKNKKVLLHRQSENLRSGGVWGGGGGSNEGLEGPNFFSEVFKVQRHYLAPENAKKSKKSYDDTP